MKYLKVFLSERSARVVLRRGNCHEATRELRQLHDARQMHVATKLPSDTTQ